MTLPDSFQGYPRSSGRPGIRNRLAILSLCGLNAPGARKIGAALPDAALISSNYGRGQLGADKAFHDRMFTGFGTHPNVGAAVVLAADAEMRRRLQEKIEETGRPVIGFSLQESGEDSERFAADAIAAGHELQAGLDAVKRSTYPMKDLVLAVECGHSDASSGLAANPLVGDLADVLVAAGGAVVFSETMEWLGTEPSLYARCSSPDVASRLQTLVEARHEIARTVGRDLRLGNPGPQNHAGGITTLEEKSHGAVSKGGTSPIVGALAQAEPVLGNGLHLMDTPTLSPESISSMVVGGAQLVIFTTGHGNPYGSAVAPTLKVTANPQTAARLPRQIDFDASSVFLGERSRDDILPDLAQLLATICDGLETAAERLDECGEAISRLGPSV